jgi:hypothetical protein
MNTEMFKPTPAGTQPIWKSEDYKGKKMHVCTQRRVHENAALVGHGEQWSFTVKITDQSNSPMPYKSASAASDPELFYTTQAIAEDMGFLKGRELIDGA